jgi:hypothetical protein
VDGYFLSSNQHSVSVYGAQAIVADEKSLFCRAQAINDDV